MRVRQGVTGGKAETELHVGHCAKFALFKHIIHQFTHTCYLFRCDIRLGVSVTVVANIL